MIKNLLKLFFKEKENGEIQYQRKSEFVKVSKKNGLNTIKYRNGRVKIVSDEELNRDYICADHKLGYRGMA